MEVDLFMKWTDEQRDAIEIRDKNILVAAAAGSGKTAVLVERIRRLVVEEGESLDRMLIVTFTNAAAAEMKEKIRIQLSREAEKCSRADRERYLYLKEQLRILPKANISTFHGFAQKVIKNFFYLADVEPGYSICDDKDTVLLMGNAMDKLMDSEYEKLDEDFVDFLNAFSSDRSDRKVSELIMSNYEKLMAMPDPWKWLDGAIDNLENTDDFSNRSAFRELMDITVKKLTRALISSQMAQEILENEGLDRLASLVGEEEAIIAEMIGVAEASDFESVRELLSSGGWKTLRARKDEKETYDMVSESVKSLRNIRKKETDELKELFYSESLDDQLEELKTTVPLAKTFRRLITEFHRLFTEEKLGRKMLDFSDLEHYCLGILRQDEAAEYYRNKFDFIFIDEYQDTNYLQEEIIGCIKRENNLFLVGDVKQSIYGFRQAEPGIFKEKYSAFSREEEVFSTVVDLNRNFRSKAPVLEKINEIFQARMEGYDDAAKLYYGGSYSGELQHIPEIKAIERNLDSLDPDDEIADMKAVEIEALYTADMIKNIAGQKYFDSNEGCEKTISYGDIVILLRSVRNGRGEAYADALKKAGIDSYIQNNEGYFDTIEISVFLNLLEIIDNTRQDVQLISVLHSEIFGFDSHSLARIRSEHSKGSFYDALFWYSQNGVNEVLKNRCQAFFNQIATWKRDAKIMSLGKFIWKLMEETGYYIIMGAMPEGDKKQANLRLLVDRAEDFAGKNQGTLYGFVRYINAIKEKEIDTGQAKLVNEHDDIVRIMTIHKSKGLEFPVVILGSCGTKLSHPDRNSGIMIDRELGIGVSLTDYELGWSKKTLVQNLMTLRKKSDEEDEELRVLYVALTRAMERLYILGTVNNPEELLEETRPELLSKSSFISWLKGTKGIKVGRLNSDMLESAEGAGEDGDGGIHPEYEGKAEEEKVNLLKYRMGFEYPYDVKDIRTKYTATSLNSDNLYAVKTRLPYPSFVKKGVSQLTPSRVGTIYHGIMERLDFVKAQSDDDYIRDTMNSLAEKGIYSQEEIKAVSPETVARFFRTELGQRAVRAAAEGTLRKEQPFSMEAQKDGQTVMVQGTIDCYFEEEGQLILLDYKNSYISMSKNLEDEKERLRDSYRNQIDIYRRALEEATGQKVKEAYLYLSKANTFVEM